jgi:hypothetical protein
VGGFDEKPAHLKPLWMAIICVFFVPFICVSDGLRMPGLIRFFSFVLRFFRS